MATQFQFIDASGIDAKSRRAIRSHAMKGKNVGKVRAPRKQPQGHDKDSHIRNFYNLDERRCTNESASSDSSNHKSTVVSLDFGIRPMLVAQIGNELSGLASACEVTPQARHVMLEFLQYVGEALYPEELCNSTQRPKAKGTIWFQYIFEDEAFFHCFAALSEASMDFVAGKDGEHSPDYRQHMAAALRLINNNLSNSNAVGDTNLASVIFMCMQSGIREQPAATKIHFDGLCRMIELRGGVGALQSNPAILEKAQRYACPPKISRSRLTKYTRIDIDLALQLGCEPRLGHSAKHLNAVLNAVSHLTVNGDFPAIDGIQSTDLEIFSAAQDIMKMTNIFNSGVVATKLSPEDYWDIITTSCYRLLEMRPLGSLQNGSHLLANAIHLGLLSFMSTFLIQIGRQRRLPYKSLSQELMKSLEDPTFQATIDARTHLWLLVMAGISVLSEQDRQWLKPRLVQAAEWMGKTQWDVARELLMQYPWISDLHDLPAAQLWKDCFPTLICGRSNS